MSIERNIVQRLFESKELYEAEFQSGGSIYKCAFGKYYKDGEEISREEYFKAKETSSGDNSAPTKRDAYGDYVKGKMKYEEEIIQSLSPANMKAYETIENQLQMLSPRDVGKNNYEKIRMAYSNFANTGDLTQLAFVAKSLNRVTGGNIKVDLTEPKKSEETPKAPEKKEAFQFANMNDKKKFAMDINRHILPNHSKDRNTQVEMKDDSVYVTLGEKDLDNELLMSRLRRNGFGDPVEGMSFPGRRGTYTTMPYVGGGEEKKFKSKTPEKKEETPKAPEKKEEGSIDRSSLKMSPEDSPLHDTEIWNSAVDNLSDEDAKKLLSYKRKLDKAKRAYQKNPSSSNLSQLNSIGRYYEEFEKEVGLRDKDGYPIGTKSRKDSSDSTQNNNAAPQKSSDSSSFSDMVSTHAQEAGSKMKKDKNGPYFYDGGDKTKFSNAVGSMAKEFSETHSAVSQYQISKSQSCYYDEESGMALVVKNSETPGKSWAQIKKLSDDEVAKLKPVR